MKTIGDVFVFMRENQCCEPHEEMEATQVKIAYVFRIVQLYELR